MRQEALDKVEVQWGRRFQLIKVGVNRFFVTHKRVAEMENF